MAKKLHPDVSMIPDSGKHFIRLKRDYEESLVYFRNRPFAAPAPPEERPGRDECISIFIDLLSSNFPVDRTIRDSNRLYLSRMEKLNSGLGGDLFYRFEEDMYRLKGKTVISNQPYALVKQYFYRFLDFTFSPNAFNRSYLTIGFDQVRTIFEKREMGGAVRFLDWMTEGIF